MSAKIKVIFFQYSQEKCWILSPNWKIIFGSQ